MTKQLILPITVYIENFARLIKQNGFRKSGHLHCVYFMLARINRTGIPGQKGQRGKIGIPGQCACNRSEIEELRSELGS